MVATTVSAATVPKAAPSTPNPAPGIKYLSLLQLHDG